MKILHISTTDRGGAGIAAYRLHKGLQDEHIDSKMLVQRKYSNDPSVLVSKNLINIILNFFSKVINRILRFFLKTSNSVFHSINFISSLSLKKIAYIKPDIVNLHWISSGYLSLSDLIKIKEPIVWTLHDMWAFSGAEHYNFGDKRYQEGYYKNNRPSYESGFDLNRWVWDRKMKLWRNLKNITIVTPSRWLADCARNSILFKNYRIEVIPNGVDITIFSPMKKENSRKKFDLPENKFLICFGAQSIDDKRKGFKYLKEAINLLPDNIIQNSEIIIFGDSKSKPIFDKIPVNYVGILKDGNSLAMLYSATDVFILPSLEDNLPNTVLESMACGTPVVAFNIGGVPDIIEHQINGYLARPYESQDLMNGILWVLQNNKQDQISTKARKTIEEEFTSEIQAKRYISLYKEILTNGKIK